VSVKGFDEGEAARCTTTADATGHEQTSNVMLIVLIATVLKSAFTIQELFHNVFDWHFCTFQGVPCR